MSKPLASASKAELAGLIVPQVIYLASLLCWAALSFSLLFACDSSSNRSCQRMMSLSGILLLAVAYPAFVFLECILAWVFFAVGKKRLAMALNLLPILHAILYVAVYAYIAGR